MLNRITTHRVLSLRILQKAKRLENSIRTISSSSYLCHHHCKSLGPMTAHHSSLPHQPVPPLGTTMERYLKAVRPLVTEEEYKHTQELVEKFVAPGSVGHKLHSFLQERAKELDNWMGDWWLKMDFLEYRLPLVVFSNPASYWGTESFSNREEYLRYAAQLINGVVDYKKLIDLHQVPPDKLKGEPLDMNQYFRIFSACRNPKKGCDELKLYGDDDKPPNHIVVVRNNQYFLVEVYDSNGKPFPESVIYDQLRKIMEQATEPDSPVGVFTTENRDVWAEIYNRLQEDETNKRSMDIIQRCMFMVCLDRPIKDVNAEPVSSRLHNCLHGGGSQYNSCNRWYDKCLQFIVSEDGTVGLNMEHSPAEGYSLVKMIDHITSYMKKNIDWTNPGSAVYPRKLEFNLSAELKRDITTAKSNLNGLIKDADLACLIFSNFGKNYIKSINLSPDSFLQMAMALALYRLHGLQGVLYEVATMHRFLHGRMEIVHSTSSETVDFCKTMLNPKATVREKAVSLRTAVAAHKAMVHEAHRGEGLDTILLGLKRAAKEIGIEVPKLFEDYGFLSCYHYRVFTSQLSMETKSVISSYGPLTDDGYGCPYHLFEDKLQFVALSLHHVPETNSSNYVRAIELSLNEMECALKEAGDISITYEF